MKKARRSGGMRKSSGKGFRSSSSRRSVKSSRKSSGSGGGFFSRKVFGKLSGRSGGPKSHASGKPSKPVPGGFKKPHNDPGLKIRPETEEAYDEGTYTGSDSGGGCCSSISGIMTLIVIGVIVVVVIFVIRCTNC